MEYVRRNHVLNIKQLMNNKKFHSLHFMLAFSLHSFDFTLCPLNENAVVDHAVNWCVLTTSFFKKDAEKKHNKIASQFMT